MGSYISSGPVHTFRRLMIFIDGSNFLGGIAKFQEKTGKKYIIDYPALERNLISNGAKHCLISLEHIKTFFYGPKGTPEELKAKGSFTKLIEQLKRDLENAHVKLVLKEKIKGKEKNIDAALVTDFLSLAYSSAYDYAILVSGDADFISAIDEVKRLGKIVCCVSFKEDFNEELTQHIDKVIFLEQYAVHFLKEVGN